jgi:Ca2+-binding RTX toxin-like protein
MQVAGSHLQYAQSMRPWANLLETFAQTMVSVDRAPQRSGGEAKGFGFLDDNIAKAGAAVVAALFHTKSSFTASELDAQMDTAYAVTRSAALELWARMHLYPFLPDINGDAYALNYNGLIGDDFVGPLIAWNGQRIKYESLREAAASLQADSEGMKEYWDRYNEYWDGIANSVILPKCFAAGTLILMADGTSKRIEDVRVGDFVASFDVDRDGVAGKLLSAPVTRLFRNVTEEWVELSNGLVVTPGHHFLAPDGNFRTTLQLLRDDGNVVLASGLRQKITGTVVDIASYGGDRYEEVQSAIADGSSALSVRSGWQTYNFEVASTHTYVAGGVRVHNQSAFTATGRDLDLGSYTNAKGQHLVVHADGVVENLDTGTRSGPAGQFKFANVDTMEAALRANISPADQSAAANAGFFAHYQITGSGPAVTLASGAVTTVGTVFGAGDGYERVVNANGSVTNLKTGYTSPPSQGDNGKFTSPGGGSTVTLGSGTKAQSGTVFSPGNGYVYKVNDDGTVTKVGKTPSNSNSSSGAGSPKGEYLGASPILLDLDGDGVEIVPVTSSNTFVDMAGDGKQHRTAWAGVGDGILVRDDGNDGVINQHREIIFTEWDAGAKTDFEALRNVFDTNHDGILSSADADWSLFKVLVTRADGSTELKTLADLGITSINLVSNEQDVTFADGSKINGTTTYTKAGGGTGTVGDVSLAYDANGYIVAETRSTDGSGNMTLVHRATRADGSLASQTTTVTSASGLSRTVSFDREGDGVLDEVQTDVTVVNGDGSRTRTLSTFDGSGTILARREVNTTSADGKTVSITRDLDGSGNNDESESRSWDGSNNLTLTITHLNADGSTKDEVTTVTSASGLSKTRQFEFTGSGAINATETTASSVDGSGTRTEVKTSYAGSGTLAANRVGSVTITTTADGTNKVVAADLDGDGTVDLTTSNVIVHNWNGSTTTTISDTNGDASLRDRTVTDLSTDGHVKVVSVDANGDGTYELVASETTIINGDGSTVRATTQTSADGTLLSGQEQTWTADQRTRFTSIDSDGDGKVDATETVLIVAGSSVTTSTAYSANGATRLSQTMSATSSDGLNRTVSVDANGDGNTDSTITRVTAIVSGVSTVTTSTWNGDQTILIGKVVETTSADGLSVTTESYLGTAGSPNQKQTDVTVKNGDSSITRTVTAFEGTSLTQTGKVVTLLSADRLTTTESVYLGTNASPEKVTSSVTANSGAVTVTTSQYTPDGSTLVGRTVSALSSDGLSSTNTVDAEGNGVTDGTLTSVKTLNSNGTTTLVETQYAGSGTAAGNRVGQVTTDVSANGLQATVQTDVNGDGTADRRTVATTTLNSDGSTTKTVTQTNGSGSLQLGKSVATVSDDGWTTTTDTFLGTHTAYDARVVNQKAVSNAGVQTATQFQYSANGTLIGKTIQTVSANGLVSTVAADLDGNALNDLVTTTTESAAGSTTVEGYSYNSTGVAKSHVTTTISADGLSSSTIDDLDNNGVTDRSWTSVTSLNANGSVTVTATNYGAGAVLQDRVTTTKSADGLTLTSDWDATGGGVTTGSSTDATVIASDGSVTRTLSIYNANASLHDRTIVLTSADGRSVTTTEDINGDGTVDHTTVQVQAGNGTVTLSSMDGTVQSASGRLYGSVHGRYETVSADGLTTTVRYEANGDSLAEKQTVSAVTLNTDGSRVVSLTNSNLSGGVAGSANPSYTVTLASKSTITTSKDGLSVTSQYDLTGAGSYQESKTDITVLNADGSSTETISNSVGATLKSRYEQTTSGDGLTTTKQWDTTGAGSFGQASTAVTAVNADGSRTVITTNTGAAGALVSKSIATTSADGRTTTIQKDLDGNTTYEEKQVVTSEVRADGSTVQTVANYVNTTTLRDYTKTDVSADGRIITVTRDDDQNGQAEQTEVTFHRVDGSTVVTTTDYTAAGKVAASLVSTTSQDGLLITSSRDNDGDGIIDKTTTRTLYNNADGSSGSTLQVYQTSEKLSNGGVVAIPQVLSQTIVVAVSADGKTTTSTVDVDGDGTVDETSTSVTRVDGSVVTSVTDSATARGFNLSTGDARWSSAIATSNKTIAAASITTVARDGLTHTVAADYDGNGTYEHEEAWATHIDGVQVATIVDKNGSGTVVQSGTETISADGRTVTLLTDLTNDGIIDRKEVSFTATSGAKTKTTTDYNSSGVAVQTIVTTVSANGDKITLTGTSAAETLQGTSADEILIGGAGADKLIGGGGTDTASYANASAAVTVNMGNTGLNTGEASGDTFDSIENLVGSDYNDTLTARSTGFRVEYFKLSSAVTSVNSVNWSATPNYVTTDGYANWDKGTGAIYSGGAKDNVAIRMKGDFYVATAGTYTFYDTSDDGSRVYIDGVEVINNDGVHDASATATANVTLSAGTHQIEVKYFEASGGANLKLEWSGSSFSRKVFEANSTAPGTPVAGLLANYFAVSSGIQSLDSMNWTATPIHTEVWSSAQKNFGSGAIYTNGPTDRTAIQLKGNINVTTAGTYKFYATSDDGAQIYVDGVRVVNNDGSHAVSTVSGTVSLTAGNHAIEIRYYDDVSVAELTVEYEGPGVTKQVLSSTNTTYTPPGTPAAVIFGGAGNDTVTGSTAGDALWGQAGTDTLNGGDGDDKLVGGTGADSLTGGNGVDIVSYEDAASGVTVNLGSMGSNTGDASGDTYSSIEIVVGSTFADTMTAASATSATFDGGGGNDTITGSSASDYLYGGTGSDSISGGSGADLMVGQEGDDTYTVDNAADSVVEDVGTGTDLVKSSVTYTLTANVENLTLTGSSNLSGTGNALDNVITGNSGNNTLTGGDGNDTLNGNGGTDTMVGGNGNDIYYVDGSTDVVTELTGAGTDEVRSTITYTLGNYVENLALQGSSTINGTGNSLANVITGNTANNTLTGNDGNDTLDGGAGNDTLVGGLGDDTFVVDSASDVVTESSGQGTDTVRSSAATYTLASNVENLVLIGVAAISGTGNTANNTLAGNAAANTLDGGTGADTLVGGLGDDTYVVDNAGDVVTEASNEGVDTVKAGLTYTLGANLENLTLTGTSAINGTGNSLNNVITGNSGVNSLSGGVGDDVLIGGGGGDTLNGGDGFDIASYETSSSWIYIDLRVASSNYSGDALNDTYVGFEAIRGGSAADDLISIADGFTLYGGLGNDFLQSAGLNGTLYGEGGDDELWGGAGDDRIYGGIGLDLIRGYAGDDQIWGGDGVDTILGYEGNDIIYGGDGDDAITGDEGKDIIFGDAGDDSLQGADDDDILYGGAGADWLHGGAGNDVLYGGDGDDTLVGYDGSDAYFGGNGYDMASFADASAAISLNTGLNASTYGGAAYGDTFHDIEAMRGTDYADTITIVEANFTVYAGTGNDTITVTGANATVRGEGGADNITTGSTADVVFGGDGDDIIHLGDGDDAVSGDDGNDTIYGEAGGDSIQGEAGNDTVYGGDGNDWIHGSSGADYLYGGNGSDTFEYLDVTDSNAANRDRIYDFATGDRIKVASIDANSGVGGDQAFVLDTNASFSAGEIRQTVVGSDLLIEFNINSDSTAEMSILLVGRTTALVASDFTL